MSYATAIALPSNRFAAAPGAWTATTLGPGSPSRWRHRPPMSLPRRRPPPRAPRRRCSSVLAGGRRRTTACRIIRRAAGSSQSIALPPQYQVRAPPPTPGRALRGQGAHGDDRRLIPRPGRKRCPGRRWAKPTFAGEGQALAEERSSARGRWSVLARTPSATFQRRSKSARAWLTTTSAAPAGSGARSAGRRLGAAPRNPHLGRGDLMGRQEPRYQRRSRDTGGLPQAAPPRPRASP